jgi:quinol monooxygenase YgiN
MIMTSLEAHVELEKQETLKQALKSQVESKLPGLIEAVLARSSEDPNLWRLMGFWESRDVFEKYRRSVDVVAGILIFRAAGAEPRFSVFDVVQKQKLA